MSTHLYSVSILSVNTLQVRGAGRSHCSAPPEYETVRSTRRDQNTPRPFGGGANSFIGFSFSGRPTFIEYFTKNNTKNKNNLKKAMTIPYNLYSN